MKARDRPSGDQATSWVEPRVDRQRAHDDIAGLGRDENDLPGAFRDGMGHRDEGTVRRPREADRVERSPREPLRSPEATSRRAMGPKAWLPSMKAIVPMGSGVSTGADREGLIGLDGASPSRMRARSGSATPSVMTRGSGGRERAWTRRRRRPRAMAWRGGGLDVKALRPGADLVGKLVVLVHLVSSVRTDRSCSIP